LKALQKVLSAELQSFKGNLGRWIGEEVLTVHSLAKERHRCFRESRPLPTCRLCVFGALTIYPSVAAILPQPAIHSVSVPISKSLPAGLLEQPEHLGMQSLFQEIAPTRVWPLFHSGN
jgi:hypothetical protein